MKAPSVIRCFVVAGVLLQCTGLLLSEDSDPLLNRLHSASNAAALTGEGVDPFYLKIDVQLYDDKGKPSEKGTIEQWRAGETTAKTVFTMPSYSATQMRKGDELFSSPGDLHTPNLLRTLLDQVVNPMPPWSRIEGSKPLFQKIKLGAVPLECIVLTLKSDPHGVPPEYCFDPGEDSLRLTFEYGNRVTVRNGMGTFQHKEVPVDVTVRNGALMAATGHISALMSRPITATDLSAEGLTSKVVLSSPVITAGRLLKSVDPIYPELAKQQHLAGVVVLDAVIGPNGHINSLELVSSPSQILTQSAEAAVKKWAYTPYEVNGVATAVETTISVHYTFGTQ